MIKKRKEEKFWIPDDFISRASAESLLCLQNFPISKTLINPSFSTAEHPGLLTLWSDTCPAEDKWKMLCWIVSPVLVPNDVLEVPEELRVPAMAIFYMTNVSFK